MAIVEKAKENPMLATLVMVGSIAVAGVGIWEGAGLVDKLHTTSVELAAYDRQTHQVATEQFARLQSDIGRIEIISKCRWLKSEIRALEDSIYVRERDGADPDYINQLAGDLDDLEEDYAALNCARLLA